MENDRVESFETRPLRRNTGTMGRPPQRGGTNPMRQPRVNMRHVPPREVVPGGTDPYYQEPENISDYAAPFVQQPPPPAPFTGYQVPVYATYNPYGTVNNDPRPPPAQQHIYGYDTASSYREPYYHGDPRLQYEYLNPRTRRETREYSRSRSHSSGVGQRQRRYPRAASRSSVSSTEDEVIIRPERRSRRRPHFGARLHERYYSDEEGNYDDLPEGRVFSFTPMRGEPQSSEEENSTAVFAEFQVLQNQDQPAEARIAKFKEKGSDENDGFSSSFANKLLHIVKSQYAGEDAYYDGDHSVKLTVAHDPKHSGQPLFRWLHLQQRQLNLDELSAEISRIPNLSSEELHGITKLLGQVRNNIKHHRTANGQSVKHMVPGTTRITITGGNAPGNQRSDGKNSKKPLTWLCIPYLSLEKYSGLMSASTTAGFPPETLLQYDYAASAQERDMEQVVALAKAAPEGECIHVNQLWSIVLGHSFLITCGHMPSVSLRDNVVKIVTEPPLETASKTKSIYVSYCHTVLWALPLDTCRTWFSFVKHFHDFWPQAIRFYHRDKIITENDWPQMVYRASSTQTTVELRMSPHPQPPPTGVLQPIQHNPGHQAQSPQKDATQVPKTLSQSVNNAFHVFTWMDIAKPKSVMSAELNVDNILKQLAEAHKYLGGSTSGRDRKIYEAGRLSTQEKLHAYLEAEGKVLDSSTEEDTSKRDDWTSCVDLYNAAEIIFRFFLPRRFDSSAPTVGKFWGAIEVLVEAPLEATSQDIRTSRGRKAPRQLYLNRGNIISIGASLRATIGVIQSFQSTFSHLPADERAKIEVPNSLICAWLHLLLALVQGAHDGLDWQENFGIADALITKGMGEIMENLSAPNLLQTAAIHPLELISLMSKSLFQDSIGIDQTLSDTYYQYMKRLENEINDNPDRSHQYRINQLKKELDIIQRLIKTQQTITAGMMPPKPTLDSAGQSRAEARILEKRMDEYDREKSRIQNKMTYMKSPGYYYEREASYPPFRDAELLSSNRDPDEFSRLSPIDPGGFAEFFVRECMSLLERRENDFQDFLVEASRLEAYNVTNIDITKDKQEKAVYAFTMVTIIFLPLGTISSIFGMNTSDIANLEMSQWIYWATALPVTLLVIVGGLWWMGELQDIIEWLFRRPKTGGSRRRNNANYAIAPAAQAQNPFAPVHDAYVVPPLPPPPQPMTYALPSRRRTGYRGRF
ncbi:hypothetical protein BKA67DRAFT_409341 [Truncatella angustata]|uniref:Uncharacterized protein n=1 Tax=Truncatella angustata TaxID=152316 RepID=A0A9P8ZST0_9PEZI|nr:uncharacterized protein BKA67DRAFT_409341 [Truncatella angustata]KAH6648167.1 hypothetical protein BKA67DRAFT_409341 [Truncatella angustata]